MIDSSTPNLLPLPLRAWPAGRQNRAGNACRAEPAPALDPATMPNSRCRPHGGKCTSPRQKRPRQQLPASPPIGFLRLVAATPYTQRAGGTGPHRPGTCAAHRAVPLPAPRNGDPPGRGPRRAAGTGAPVGSAMCAKGRTNPARRRQIRGRPRRAPPRPSQPSYTFLRRGNTLRRIAGGVAPGTEPPLERVQSPGTRNRRAQSPPARPRQRTTSGGDNALPGGPVWIFPY